MKARAEGRRGVGNSDGDAAREGFGDRLQVDVKMIGLEEPVFAAITAVQRNPIHGAFCELEFPRGVAAETDARDHGMLEARPWTFLFCGSSRPGSAFRRAWRHGDTVELNGGAGRGAGDLQLVGMSTRRARHIRNKTGPRVRSEREALRGPRQEDENTHNLPQSELSLCGK